MIESFPNEQRYYPHTVADAKADLAAELAYKRGKWGFIETLQEIHIELIEIPAEPELATKSQVYELINRSFIKHGMYRLCDDREEWVTFYGDEIKDSGATSTVCEVSRPKKVHAPKRLISPNFRSIQPRMMFIESYKNGSITTEYTVSRNGYAKIVTGTYHEMCSDGNYSNHEVIKFTQEHIPISEIARLGMWISVSEASESLK